MKVKHLALLLVLAFIGTKAMACYTVYDRNDRVIYQGATAPVDMSLPLHQTLGKRFPGAHMVFDLSNSCSPISISQVTRPATNFVPAGTIRMERTGRQLTPNSSSPLFTDRGIALRNKLPHTPVVGNIVVVPAAAVANVDLPTFTVIPADTSVTRAPAVVDTRAMGAGPARQSANSTVITEMRDGATYVQTQRGAVPPVQY